MKYIYGSKHISVGDTQKQLSSAKFQLKETCEIEIEAAVQSWL